MISFFNSAILILLVQCSAKNRITCIPDSSQTVVMPVKNCGNVTSKVAFDLQSHVTLFDVSPQHALLAPGEQVEVSIKFTPNKSTPNKIQSTFLMKVFIY